MTGILSEILCHFRGHVWDDNQCDRCGAIEIQLPKELFRELKREEEEKQ